MDLLHFQTEDVVKLKSKRSRLIGNDPGTGKTYEGIALDLANREKDGHPKVVVPSHPKTLVICPKTVLGVWDQHLMDLTEEDVYLLDPKRRGRFVADALNPRNDGYFICNWDSLRLMPELARVEWFHIIGDEIHRAKNRKAQVFRALKRLRTTYKTGMSGTPADDKPQDLWAILNWLWPNYYTSFWKFVDAYCEMDVDVNTGYRKFAGVNTERIPHLRKQMEPWFVRRRKEDVLPDLPNKYYSRITVELTPKQRRAYDQMRKTMIAWVEAHKEELDREDPVIAQAAVVQLIRLQQYADGYVVPRLDADGNHMWIVKHKGHRAKEGTPCPVNPETGRVECKTVYLFDVIDPSSKLDVVMELLEDRSDEQIIIFSQFKSVIRLLASRLEKAQVPYGMVTGDVKAQDRTDQVAAFQRGDLRVFVGTIGAAREGITLTASSTVVFIDRAWSPSQNTQAEDRAHRIGQQEAVQVIDIVAKNTVDLGRHQKIAMKRKWLQMLLGDEINELQYVVEELEEYGNFEYEEQE